MASSSREKLEKGGGDVGGGGGAAEAYLETIEDAEDASGDRRCPAWKNKRTREV
jgi:hypothetical protein